MLLDSASKDPDLKKVLVATAVDTEKPRLTTPEISNITRERRQPNELKAALCGLGRRRPSQEVEPLLGKVEMSLELVQTSQEADENA